MQKKILYFLYTNFQVACALRLLLCIEDAVNKFALHFYKMLKPFAGKDFSMVQGKR
jgi:hypothetical protein